MSVDMTWDDWLAWGADIKEEVDIKCPQCLVKNNAKDWKMDRISLPEKRWGKGASHIRSICSNCFYEYDHLDEIDEGSITPEADISG